MTGLLLALDVPDLETAISIARTTEPYVAGYKVGLQLLLGPDPHSVEQIAGLGKPVFVDAKLHDIPATVERAAEQLGRRGARWVTVHSGGGSVMLEAGVEGLTRGSDGTAGVLAVTVLTHLADSDLGEIGLSDDVPAQTRRLVALAAAAGCEGVICSAHEAELTRGTPLIAVTPGVRPAGSSADDQTRVATPAMAARAGSAYVVVGRPITRAADMAGAAAAVRDELSDPFAAAPENSNR